MSLGVYGFYRVCRYGAYGCNRPGDEQNEKKWAASVDTECKQNMVITMLAFDIIVGCVGILAIGFVAGSRLPIGVFYTTLALPFALIIVDGVGIILGAVNAAAPCGECD